MKKLLLTLGAITSVVAPVTVVVACSNKDGESLTEHTVQFNASLTDLRLQDLSGMRSSAMKTLTAKGYPFNDVSQNQFMMKFGTIYTGSGSTYRELLNNLSDVKINDDKILDVLGLGDLFKDSSEIMLSGFGNPPFEFSKEAWDKFIPGVDGSFGLKTGFEAQRMGLDPYFESQFPDQTDKIKAFTKTDDYYNMLVKNIGKETVVKNGIYRQVDKKAFYVDEHIALFANGKEINLDDKLTTKKVELTVKVVND